MESNQTLEKMKTYHKNLTGEPIEFGRF